MIFFARRRGAPAAVRLTEASDVATFGKLSSEASALAEAGRVDELRMLLNASPQMARSADEHSFTLLMHACGEGHIGVVQLLLEMKCDTDCINAINGRGNSALHLCASMGHSACVSALLRAGANPRLVGPDGKTAADFARALGHAQAAALLEDCRDLPGAGRGQRPFDAAGASAEGNLQSHLDIDGSDSDSDSADGLDAAAQVRAASSASTSVATSGPRSLQPRDHAYALLDADLRSLEDDAREELRTVLEMVLENLAGKTPRAGEENEAAELKLEAKLETGTRARISPNNLPIIS